MNRKKELFQEYETDLNSKDDFSSLKNNVQLHHNAYKPKKRVWLRVLVTTSIVVAVLLPIGAFAALITGFGFKTETHESVKQYKTTYTVSEQSAIEASSFEKLNKVTYPSVERKDYEIEENYKSAINDFTYDIFNDLYENGNQFSFSPLGLYFNLSLMSLATSQTDVKNEFSTLLHYPMESMSEQYRKAYENNYVVSDNGTVQFYNGCFINKLAYTINSDFIGDLTNHYTEAYSLNMKNDSDVDKILSWVDQKTQETNYLSKENLNINDDTRMLMLSTMYFNNKWINDFVTADSYTDDFYCQDGTTKQVSYLYHSYNVSQCYDYGTYISVPDYYCNGYSVQYLVPKSTKDDIHSLVKGVNFLKEDESKAVKSSIEGYPMTIKLSLPKFEDKSTIDLTDILKKSSIASTFDKQINSFDRIYEDNDEENMYLDKVQQKNHIVFSETGTKITSTTLSVTKGYGSAAYYSGDTLEVKLNQPFIYIIKDSQGLPIYIGNCSNPIE